MQTQVIEATQIEQKGQIPIRKLAEGSDLNRQEFSPSDGTERCAPHQRVLGATDVLVHFGPRQATYDEPTESTSAVASVTATAEVSFHHPLLQHREYADARPNDALVEFAKLAAV
jgi:hypothetical protein